MKNTDKKEDKCTITAVGKHSELLKGIKNLPSETKDYRNTKHGLVWKNK